MRKPTDLEAGCAVDRPATRRSGVIGRLWSHALGRLLRLSIKETLVSTRGFRVDSPQVAQRLEDIGASFAHGYNTAIRSDDLGALASALQTVAAADSGFAFEGAAMGLALTDCLTPGRQWFDAFVAGPARHHEYMVWVGLGWALARLPVSPLRALRRYRSINKWLALDGYGFHQGYFGWRQAITRQRRPSSLAGSAARVFDQGLGRSLWFVFGADPAAVAPAIEAFDPDRQGDLWSGVGLAATYAGGVEAIGLQALHAAAGRHAPALGQGVIFAAAARRRAGNPVAHAELACQVILGLGLNDAAALALRYLPAHGDDVDRYQLWRSSIQAWCGRELHAARHFKPRET